MFKGSQSICKEKCLFQRNILSRKNSSRNVECNFDNPREETR